MGLTAQECTLRSNRLLFQSTSPEKFVTLFFAILDLRANILSYANAGHEHPIVLSSSGSVNRLVTGGIMLGMMDDFPFQDDSVQIHPGDIMVIFSDGVTEAMNGEEVQFGDARLRDTIIEHRNEDARTMLESIVSTVKSHAGAAPQMDDITILVVKRLEA